MGRGRVGNEVLQPEMYASRDASGQVVEKALLASPWGLMRTFGGVNQLKARTQSALHRRTVIALNRQAAASLRAVEGEGGHDDPPVGSQCPKQLAHIYLSVFGFGQEVKERAVVPQRIPGFF